jgi:hypothetical protein
MLLRRDNIKRTIIKIECSQEEKFSMTSIRNAAMNFIFTIFVKGKNILTA